MLIFKQKEVMPMSSYEPEQVPHDSPHNGESKLPPFLRWPFQRPQRTAGSPRPPRSHWWYALVLMVCLSISLFVDVTGNLNTVSAASTTQFTPQLSVAQVNNTLQNFLKQAHASKGFDGLHVSPSNQAPLTSKGNPGSTANDATIAAFQAKPSAEPPSMKAATASIPTSYLTAAAAPVNAPAFVAQAYAAATPALHLSGSDSGGVRMELDIPSGALDFSSATTTSGAALKGPLSITLTQVRGHYYTATLDLATYQIGMTDATGAAVQGVKLSQAVTYTFHYRQSELTDDGIDPSRLYLRWDSTPMTTWTAASLSSSSGTTDTNTPASTTSS